MVLNSILWANSVDNFPAGNLSKNKTCYTNNTNFRQEITNKVGSETRGYKVKCINIISGVGHD